MKGIILAGGAGTRLYPLTTTVSKQLQPVYDKPMIYYPLSTLMLAGIRDILLISDPVSLPLFSRLLGDGERLGITIRYAVQAEPKGIAQALIIAEAFLGGESSTLILGDNLFYGKMNLDGIVSGFRTGAHIFGYPVKDPERYGVVDFYRTGEVKGLIEKPKKPKSRYAVPGLYIYDGNAPERARNLTPSARGELEITDLNRVYLEAGELTATKLGRGIAWLDTGTPESLLEAGTFVHTVEARQGFKIACPEEIAYRKEFITRDDFDKLAFGCPPSAYRDYLTAIADEEWEDRP